MIVFKWRTISTLQRGLVTMSPWVQKNTNCVHGLVQWHCDCYCHRYVGNFNRHFLITHRPLMVSVHLQNLFSWTRNVHLQYAWKVKCHGKKMQPKVLYKISLVNNATQKKKWKMFKFQVQCSTKIKYKNLCFSWQRHVYINCKNKQPK